MTFIQPKGISLPTAKPLNGATVVTCQPVAGDRAFALNDGSATGTIITISNFTTTNTDLLVFSALTIDSGPPGGSVTVSPSATKTFTKVSAPPPSGWASS
jgi:hypothetical protein